MDQYVDVVQALFDYKSSDEKTLSFNKGDVLFVLVQDKTGWWNGICNGRRGWFPSNFVKSIKSTLKDGATSSQPKPTNNNRISMSKTLESELESLTAMLVNIDVSQQQQQQQQRLTQPPPRSAFQNPEPEMNNNETSEDDLLDTYQGLDGRGSDQSINNNNNNDDNNAVKITTEQQLPTYWRSRTTPEGVLYYYNIQTYETTYDINQVYSTIPSPTRISDNRSPTSSSSSLEDHDLASQTRKDLLRSRRPSHSGWIPTTYSLLDPDTKVSWDVLINNILLSITKLNNAAKKDKKPKFIPSSHQVVLAIRDMLISSGTTTRDSSVLLRNRVLKSHHHTIMTSLSKLVLSAKIASGIWPPPDAVNKMRYQAGQVLLAVRHFVSVAQDSGIELVTRDLLASSLSSSLNRFKDEDMFENEFDVKGSELSELEFVGRLDSYAENIITSINELTILIRSENKITSKIIEKTQHVVIEIGQLLSLVEDIKPPVTTSSTSTTTDFITDFKASRENLYNLVSNLVSTASIAVNPYPPAHILRTLSKIASNAITSVESLIMSTKVLIDQVDLLEQKNLQSAVNYYEEREEDSDLFVLKRRAMSLNFVNNGNSKLEEMGLGRKDSLGDVLARDNSGNYREPLFAGTGTGTGTGVEDKPRAYPRHSLVITSYNLPPSSSSNSSTSRPQQQQSQQSTLNHKTTSIPELSLSSVSARSDSLRHNQKQSESTQVPQPQPQTLQQQHPRKTSLSNLANKKLQIPILIDPSAIEINNSRVSPPPSPSVALFNVGRIGKLFGGIAGNDVSQKPNTTTTTTQPTTTTNEPNETWYLDPTPSELELSYNMDNQIIGGTFPALIERLTTHTTPPPDAMFSRTFLLTFRLFSTPKDFITALEKRFFTPPPKQIITNNYQFKMWNERKLQPIRSRVVRMLCVWLQVFWLDSEDFKVINELSLFADAIYEAQPELGERVVELVRQRRDKSFSVPVVTEFKRNASRLSLFKTGSELELSGDLFLDENVIVNVNANDTTPLTTDTKPILPKTFENLYITDVDPLEIARQLTIVDYKMFSCIQSSELLREGWTKKADSSQSIHVRAITQFSTKLTEWVIQTILSEPDLKKRTIVLKHFVKTADKCRVLQNFNSVMSILSALNSSAIARLKKTWEGLSSKNRALMESLTKLTDHSKNFSEYRAVIKNASMPCLPFLGLYLTDLVFTNDGNPNFRNEGRFINFDKYVKITKIIYDLKRFQQTGFSFVEVRELQEWIRVNVEQQGQKDIDELYQMSLFLEPRVNGNRGVGVGVGVGVGGSSFERSTSNMSLASSGNNSNSNSGGNLAFNNSSKNSSNNELLVNSGNMLSDVL